MRFSGFRVLRMFPILNLESTPVPAPRSRPHPSPRKGVPGSSAVEAFSVDDISDFDDSDLEMHHL